jgi:hypothetical protein
MAREGGGVMGFDMIDRQFRRKEVRLECADCGKVAGVKVRHGGDPDEIPLCDECYASRAAENYYLGYCG